jgi:ATP-dependent DNA ligase
VLGSEIVILYGEGRLQFYDLLRRRERGDPVFYAFDLLWFMGRTCARAPAARVV